MSDVLVYEPVSEVITVAQRARDAFRRAWEAACLALDGGMSVELDVKPVKTTRSIEANACMWAHLADLSRQVVWHGQKLTAEEWKCVISAGLRHQKVVPGLEGGFVAIGMRTSKMSVKEMVSMIELIQAFGTQQGVRWTAPKWMQEGAR